MAGGGLVGPPRGFAPIIIPNPGGLRNGVLPPAAGFLSF